MKTDSRKFCRDSWSIHERWHPVVSVGVLVLPHHACILRIFFTLASSGIKSPKDQGSKVTLVAREKTIEVATQDNVTNEIQ